MALDANKTGQSIADVIAANRPAAGESVTDEGLANMWKAIVGVLFDDISADGVVSTTVTTPDTINGSGLGSIS
jgi:hypothetical protein